MCEIDHKAVSCHMERQSGPRVSPHQSATNKQQRSQGNYLRMFCVNIKKKIANIINRMQGNFSGLKLAC